jgi:ATP-dependent protease HslVU (ClpYQ) peptidase subunit
MTVIAWDGHTLAADKRAGTDMPRTVTKIYLARNGSLVGFTGFAHGDMEMLAWFNNGAKPDDFPQIHRDEAKSSHMLEITPEGQIRTYANGPYPATLEDKFHAMGSGRDFAMAAMHLGQTAEQAVAVAIALSAGCGNGIDTLTL